MWGNKREFQPNRFFCKKGYNITSRGGGVEEEEEAKRVIT